MPDATTTGGPVARIGGAPAVVDPDVVPVEVAVVDFALPPQPATATPTTTAPTAAARLTCRWVSADIRQESHMWLARSLPLAPIHVLVPPRGRRPDLSTTAGAFPD